MATTRILDHYRVSVINDKQLFYVLALIYKSGYASEKDLEAKTNLQPRELKLALTKLYRANLIRVVLTDAWAVTSFAEEMLSLLGISEAASKSFVSEQDLPQSDKVFLHACLAGSSSGNYMWSRDVSSVLRATKVAFEIASESDPIDSDERVRTLYALVIGMNPCANSVDIKTYCNKIAQWYINNHSDAAPFLLSKKSKLKDSILRRCINGVSDFKSSNQLLLTGEEGAGKIAFLITLARFIANITVQRDTCDLHLVYSMDKDVFSRGWNSIGRWQPSIKRNTAEYFEALYKDLPVNNNKGELCEKLVYLLQRYTEADNRDIETRLKFGASFNASHDFAEVLSSVSTLRKAIIGGDLDELSADEKRKVIAGLTTATEIALQRFSLRIGNKDRKS